MATTCFNCGTFFDPQASECPVCQAVLELTDPGRPAPEPREEGPNLRSLLAAAGAAAHIPLFEQHGIKPLMLPHLTNKDLREIGITSQSKRLELIDAFMRIPSGQHASQSAPGPGREGDTPSGTDDWDTGGSLLDMSFSGFVTPAVIKTLYLIAVILSILVALGTLIYATDLIGKTRRGSQGFALFLMFVAPVTCYLSILFSRIGCEATLVLFRISGDLRALRQSRQ